MCRIVAAVLGAVALLASGAADLSPAARARPALVVILVVDQMRADYVERFNGQWSSGLRRLFAQGAWFRNAAYPYLNTVTCAGHATIATGTTPATHGMVLNEWWDRDLQRPVLCVDDPESPLVSYGAPLKGAQGGARLKAPTLADEMRRQLGPSARIVSLSIKARSAIMAGQSGDAVTWFEEGTWTTSRRYSAEPVPAVAEWLRQHSIDADRQQVWDRALPRARYLFDDSPLGKKPPKGWGPSLPHALDDVDHPSESDYRARWLASPYSNDYLGRFAEHLIDRFNLGRGPSTDFLGVSFSSLDSIGHKLGPSSHEVQDALVRLDATIGRLLAHIDRRVGEGRYVLALSSDHGVSEIPELMMARGEEAGRIKPGDVVKSVDRAVSTVFGPGQYVARLFYTDLYFRPGVYARLQQQPRAMEAAIAALQHTPGIARVYRSDDLMRGVQKGDPFAEAARLGYYTGRSGDLLLVPELNWIMSGDAATHGTAHPYDKKVPVLLFGHGIQAGHFEGTATPADVAPTLAHAAGLKMSRATGRVLTEALTSTGRVAAGLQAPPKPGRPPTRGALRRDLAEARAIGRAKAGKAR